MQEFRSSEFLFRVELTPDEIAFKQELSIDLVWLEGDPVLHVIHTHANFQSATYVNNKSADELWKLFVNFLFTIFPVCQEVFRVDGKSSFNSTKFRDLTESKRVKLQFSGF